MDELSSHSTIPIDLVLDRQTLQDVLKAVIHSICFHRLLGPIQPKTFEILDVTMPGVSDLKTERAIEANVDAFWRAIQEDYTKSGQVIIIFVEKREKKMWHLLFTAEEEVPWEEWVINVEFRQHNNEQDRQLFTETLQKALTKHLQKILIHTSSESGRTSVPPITQSVPVSPFPFKIAVKVGGVLISSQIVEFEKPSQVKRRSGSGGGGVSGTGRDGY